LVNTSAQVGGALGLAVLATLSGSRTEELGKAGEDMASALTGGYHLAFLVGAVLVAVATVVALVVLEPEQRGAEREAPHSHPEPAFSESG
jgi:hypothetical protein